MSSTSAPDSYSSKPVVADPTVAPATGTGTATDITPGNPGPVLTPGFIFLRASLIDVTTNAIGYYPFFAAQSNPTSGVPTQLVVFSQGPVPRPQEQFEGKEEFVVFERTDKKFGTFGKFSWVIFSDAKTQFKGSIVGAAKLVKDDITQTFAVKKDDGHLVFEEDNLKYFAAYYCE